MAKKKKDKLQKIQDDAKKLEDSAEKLEKEAEKSGDPKLERKAEEVQEGIEDLRDQLEELEDDEKPPKPHKAKRIAIINNQTHQEIKMDTIHLGSERVYTAEGRDAQNNFAELLEGDVPVWTVSPTGVVTLFPTSDGMSCETVSVAAGDCTLTCTGKDVKGGSVTGSADINVPAAEPPLATRIELTAGPEIPV